MKTRNSFNKYAKDYDSHNIIQRIIAKALVRDIKTQPKKILELGSGSGQIIRQIDWDFTEYLALDSSSAMCELHPKGKGIEVLTIDFDSLGLEDALQQRRFDLILSASALQWSRDLSHLLKRIIPKTDEFRAVLFGSNTFQTLHTLTNKKSPILSIDEIKIACDPYHPIYEIFEYKLYFESKKELFDYIKNSGVGGSGVLSYREARELYVKYPYLYLEFEVIFITIRNFFTQKEFY